MIGPDVLWCRVVSAGVPGITTQQPFNAEPPTLHHTVPGQSFAGVVGAGWGKSARWRAKRTDQVLIDMHQLYHDSAHLFSTWLNSIFKLPACSTLSRGKTCFTSTTISSLRSLILCRRNASLIIRFTRFRSAAPDNVFLPTIIPSLAFSWLLRTKKTLKYLSAIFSARTT